MISPHHSKTHLDRAESRRPPLKLILLLCLLHAAALLAVFLATRAVYGQSSSIGVAIKAKPIP